MNKADGFAGNLDGEVMRLLEGGPGAESLIADPYPLYDILRNQCPVYRAKSGVWLVTSYDLCKELARDEAWQRGLATSGRNTIHPADDALIADDLFIQLARDHILSHDGEGHLRMRRALARVFTPNRLNAWREQLAQFARTRVESIRDREQIDFLEEFAWGYPVDALALVIGLPSDGRDLLFEITEVTMRHLSQNFVMTPQAVEDDNRIVEEYISWVRGVIAYRSQHLDESVLSAWISSVDQGVLSEAELISNIRLLHMAGHETTASLISNSLLCLLKHPDQLTLLRTYLDLVTKAIEETLRFESSANTLMIRVSAEDRQLGDVTIPAGQGVLGVLGAANRDPAVFKKPNMYDIHRSPNPHLAFGFGMHYCLGAPLARIEAPYAIAELLKAFVDLSCDVEHLRWRPNFTFRTLEKFPLNLRC